MITDELIYRSDALKALSNGEGCGNICSRAIRRIPAVDAAPVVHGRWIKVGDFVWKCSVCGEEVKRQDDLFCPHCGAKMETEISNMTKKKFAPSLDDAIKEFNAKWTISGAKMDGGDNHD